MAEMKPASIQTSDGICDVHVARPKQAGSYPAVLFLMDAYGPRDYLYEMIGRLADSGYIVLLPNLFYRQKPAPVISMSFPISKDELPAARAEIMSLFQNYNYEEVLLKDIPVFLKFLSEQSGFNGQTGITGYCMGGSLALRSAAQYPEKIQAAASFHAGKLATHEKDSPHLFLPKIKAEVYVAHADQDASMPEEQIQIFNKAFLEAGLKDKTEKYEGALHGFTMADLPPGNAVAIEKHWANLLTLFKKLQS
jgi:carboxymethylenebutenolidase